MSTENRAWRRYGGRQLDGESEACASPVRAGVLMKSSPRKSEGVVDRHVRTTAQSSGDTWWPQDPGAQGRPVAGQEARQRPTTIS